MPRTSRYSPEVRERAVKMVFDHRGDYPSEWAAMTWIAQKFGCTAETLRSWVRRAQVDGGVRPGLSTDERKKLTDRGEEETSCALGRARALRKGPVISSSGQYWWCRGGAAGNG
jgi:transposase-like protein